MTRLKTYGDRAFSAAAPRLWNQLPPELRSVTSVDQFRSQLKTYLVALFQFLFYLIIVFNSSFLPYYCTALRAISGYRYIIVYYYYK